MPSFYVADPETNYHQLCEIAAMSADNLLRLIEESKEIQSVTTVVPEDFDAEYEEASVQLITSALACARFRASHTPTVNINGDVIYGET